MLHCFFSTPFPQHHRLGGHGCNGLQAPVFDLKNDHPQVWPDDDEIWISPLDRDIVVQEIVLRQSVAKVREYSAFARRAGSNRNGFRNCKGHRAASFEASPGLPALRYV